MFLTLTVKHDKAQSLSELKTLVQDACTKARQGKPWGLAKKRYGIAGVMVGPEVTWSPVNGWHFHLHVAVPMLPAVSIVDPGKRWERVVKTAKSGGNWIIKRYRDYIRRAGGKTSAKAQDVQVMWRKEDLCDYLAKGSGAWEVAAAGATKTGRTGLTPWDLAARGGTSDRYAALFLEYVKAMPGTRSCVITKGLAEALGIQAESDADNPGVEEVEEEEEVVVGSVEPPRWHRLLRGGHVPDVLQAVADRRTWSDIDAMMTRLDPWSQIEAPGIDVMMTRPLRPRHMPSPELVAETAKAFRYQHRDLGRAIRAALDRERDVAASYGQEFEPPAMRRILELMAA